MQRKREQPHSNMETTKKLGIVLNERFNEQFNERFNEQFNERV